MSKWYISDNILLERSVFLWKVLYYDMVKYGWTAMRNIYVIVSDFVIHGSFYYFIVSEFVTHGT